MSLFLPSLSPRNSSGSNRGPSLSEAAQRSLLRELHKHPFIRSLKEHFHQKLHKDLFVRRCMRTPFYRSFTCWCFFLLLYCYHPLTCRFLTLLLVTAFPHLPTCVNESCCAPFTSRTSVQPTSLVCRGY